MDWDKVDELARAAYFSSEDHAVDEEDYRLGFRRALLMIQESGFSMAEQWQLNDPRYSEVDIQVDKDIYRLFYPEEAK